MVALSEQYLAMLSSINQIDDHYEAILEGQLLVKNLYICNSNGIKASAPKGCDYRVIISERGG